MAQDWIRFPFEVDGHVHLGEGAPLVRIRWAYTHLPFPPLGTPRVILNSRLNEDQESIPPVGQLPRPICHYEQDARWVTPADLNGAHQCHPEWLATGEPWPNDLPPNVYMTDGVPVCCRPDNDPAFGGLEFGGEVGDKFTPNNVRGGLEIGGAVASTLVYTNGTWGGLEVGSAVGDLFRMPEPTAGGLELGGEVGDVARLLDGLAGGLELGGEVGDLLHNPPILSLGCAAANYPTFLDAPYRITFTAAGVATYWLRWYNLAQGVLHHMTYTGLGGGAEPAIAAGRRGNTCVGTVALALSGGGGCVEFTTGASLMHWILITTPGAGTFTFDCSIHTGAC